MSDNLNANLHPDVEAVGKIPVIDNILDVICRTTGMGFATIARVTKDKWIACAVKDDIRFGLVAGGELKIETTICHEIEESRKGVVIDHVAEDERYKDHHTPKFYGFQSYISIPIILKDGSFFGTLCAIDPRPAKLSTPEVIGMFNLFAELIAFHLNAVEQITATEKKLLEEQETAEHREQFIAILGHDLRNPVAAIQNSAQLLLRMPLDNRASRLAHIIQDSSYRITGLIDNVLDFTRGRSGAGIVLERNDNEPIEVILSQVINEIQVVFPDRPIEKYFNITTPVNCDGKRLAQLFSNLLSNAITYGKKESPVKVTAVSANGQFSLCVANGGEKIPDITMAHLFQPYWRGAVEKSKDGLGLGLFIAAEIARAHGGTLSVTSTDEQTCFSLELPAQS